MKDEKSTARSLPSADTERRNAADVEDGRAGSGAALNPVLHGAGSDRAAAPTARAGTGIRVLKVPDPAPFSSQCCC